MQGINIRINGSLTVFVVGTNNSICLLEIDTVDECYWATLARPYISHSTKIVREPNKSNNYQRHNPYFSLITNPFLLIQGLPIILFGGRVQALLVLLPGGK